MVLRLSIRSRFRSILSPLGSDRLVGGALGGGLYTTSPLLQCHYVLLVAFRFVCCALLACAFSVFCWVAGYKSTCLVLSCLICRLVLFCLRDRFDGYYTLHSGIRCCKMPVAKVGKRETLVGPAGDSRRGEARFIDD